MGCDEITALGRIAYSGPLDRATIKADLAKTDSEFKEVLCWFMQRQIDDFRLDFFGANMTFPEYTQVLIQHACVHIGIWANVAAFGGFEFPQSWKAEWGLGKDGF